MARASILVVDDDELLLELLVDTLTAVGYDAVGAPGGIEALDVLQDRKFDLMITDIKMPNIDGLQLLKRVKRHYPAMPVLFITGVASPEIIGHTEADGFLAKPFRIQAIEELIESALHQKPVSAEHQRRILLVGMDRSFGDVLSEGLNCRHYLPFPHQTLKEALHDLENGSFDAVIADTEHSHTGVSDMVEQIRSLGPRIPLVLVGQSFPNEVIDRYRDRFNVSAFLEKPFKVGQVIDVLDRLTSSVSSN